MGEAHQSDHAARPLPLLWSWGLPLVVLIASNFLSEALPLTAIIFLISGSFVWMGLACSMNARRCRRRHCYYSGPIFLLGSAGVVAVGFGLVDLGSDGLIIVVSATLILAAFTYVTEPIFGKYVG